MTAYISKQLNTKQKPLLLWVLLGTIVVLSILYIYFLNMAILSVVARESINQQVILATSDVGAYEGRYASLENSITPSESQTFGLVSESQISYLSSQAPTLLSFGGTNNQ